MMIWLYLGKILERAFIDSKALQTVYITSFRQFEVIQCGDIDDERDCTDGRTR